jgi:hypothetical protein
MGEWCVMYASCMRKCRDDSTLTLKPASKKTNDETGDTRRHKIYLVSPQTKRVKA